MMTDAQYRQMYHEAMEKARAEYRAANGEPQDRIGRQKESGAVNAALDVWWDENEAKDPYFAITIDESERGCEVNDARMGGSVTVYRPRREPDLSNLTENRWRIVPGTMSGSSWQVGNYGYATCATVRRDAAVRLKIMEVALQKLNDYNLVVLEWEPIADPFKLAQYDAHELERLRREENVRHEKANAKAAAKKAR